MTLTRTQPRTPLALGFVEELSKLGSLAGFAKAVKGLAPAEAMAMRERMMARNLERYMHGADASAISTRARSAQKLLGDQAVGVTRPLKDPLPHGLRPNRAAKTSPPGQFKSTAGEFEGVPLKQLPQSLQPARKAQLGSFIDELMRHIPGGAGAMKTAGVLRERIRESGFTARPVNSSNLKTIGYDPKTKTLEVEFHTSGKYRYKDVPPFVVKRIMRSKSKGKAFNRMVRKSGLGYEKLAGIKEQAAAYARHSALNLGQAARDMRYLLDHPHADKIAPRGSLRHGLASLTSRIPSLASNVYYTVLPPQLHHTAEELAKMRGGRGGASLLDWFKSGYAPWKHKIPGESLDKLANILSALRDKSKLRAAMLALTLAQPVELRAAAKALKAPVVDVAGHAAKDKSWTRFLKMPEGMPKPQRPALKGSSDVISEAGVRRRGPDFGHGRGLGRLGSLGLTEARIQDPAIMAQLAEATKRP